MKRSFLYLFLLIGIIMLTGCANVEDHILIKDDGNVFREIVVTVDQTKDSYSEISTEMSFKEIENKFVEEGYEVIRDDIPNKGKVILKLRKVLENADQENVSILFNVEGQPNDKEILTLNTEEGFFTTKYNMNSEIILGALKGRPELSEVNYKVYLHFPSKVYGNNDATEVKDNGKTTVWEIPIEEGTKINLSATSLNVTNILMVGGPAIGLLLLILFIVRSRRQSEEDYRRVPVKEKNS